ncbi:LADA_0F05248g1_1 [Lachancea dasiensis]|uniref:LADA_0F05248g1_1 n=1 Tax=Lachancea dasiensis TaxID=1072105 RepID=A0A1G4JK31_9SACH|nr:LADA_0F05248g1_1 [Lachancea dasiensis]
MVVRHFRRKDIPNHNVSSSSESSSDEPSDDEQANASIAPTAHKVSERKPETAKCTTGDFTPPNGAVIAKEVAKESPISPSSAAKEEGLPAQNTSHRTTSAGDKNVEAAHDGSSDDASSESNSDSDSASSEDDYMLHKPMFLKKGPAKNTTSDKPAEQAIETIKVSGRTQEEKERVKKTEPLVPIAVNAHSTDQELLQTILGLDDDDSKDPENELKLWNQRQESRALRSRQLLEEKQREQEDYESAKIASTLGPLDQMRDWEGARLIKSAQNSAADLLSKQNSKLNTSGPTKKRKYNPKALQKSQLRLKPELDSRNGQEADNEYSMM